MGMHEMGYKAAYGRTCIDLADQCYDESWEFLRAGVKPLQHRRLAWGAQCWVGQAASMKDKCCKNVYQGLVRGCFNHEFTVHRCCAHKWMPGFEEEPEFD